MKDLITTAAKISILVCAVGSTKPHARFTADPHHRPTKTRDLPRQQHAPATRVERRVQRFC